MTVVKYSAEEAKRHFGFEVPIDNLPPNLTSSEQKNIKTVLEYMEIAYSPENNKGGESVAYLCHPGNTFAAPSTFPKASTAEEYADEHAKVMSSLTDLHIVRFDVIVAKGQNLFSQSVSLFLSSVSKPENFVSLRYTATGSHIGAAHNGIEATRRRAEWTAAGNFVLDEQSGKIKHWWKDWDKMRMWKQLGWVKPDNDAVEFA
ncbi:hypothetical protein K474DRAFT_1603134 [Panus rudis PR-1116 ss-1]|nr:hypothetical protein K474DRAFT_1603134 [Panus rudis PR-1116 ss-1]